MTLYFNAYFGRENKGIIFDCLVWW